MRWGFALGGALLLAIVGVASGQTPGIIYSAEEFKKLDTFEAHSLAKADKVFGKKDYKRAAAEYDSFIVEFPKSKAISYTLLRKGLCLHLLQKRFEAIKEYNEVLDYFPNDVKYAAACVYFIGQCHWENGDEDKALKAWAEMAQDPDYSKTRLAAKAINRLADNLYKREEFDQATKYWMQVARDFRSVKGAEPDAYYAIGRALPYFVLRAPDESKLREFYTTVGGFASTAAAVPEDLEKDRYYWQILVVSTRTSPPFSPSSNLVVKHGKFTDLQRELMEDYYRYWSKQMEGKFADWDDFQITLGDYKARYERDVIKWAGRLDAQFRSGWKTGDYGRVMKWIVLFASHKAKVQEYYAKLNFGQMSYGQKDTMMRIAWEQVGNGDMARSIFGQLQLTKLTDAQLSTLARWWWNKKSPLVVEQTCAAIKDLDYGRMELLRFYHYLLDTKKGLPLADEMRKVAKFANEAVLLKAQMLHSIPKYPEAIQAYKQYQPPEPVESLYPIAACFKAQGRLNQAIAQLQEVEQFFPPHASEAALLIADYYNSAGVKKKHVASLYAIMNKYPKSSQSSVAHDRLEKLGYRTGGGVKNAEE